MPVQIDFATGALRGAPVTRSRRTLGQLEGLFEDQEAWRAMDPDIAVYAIESYMPHPAGTPGSICCATTTLMAGDVAGEYFMTRGHFHQDPDGPEMTICVSGDGWLVLMDEHRQPRVERMTAGSVHHVGLRTAHRAVNVGTDPLVFVSFWASEIGHDYATIAERGFSMRLRRGQPSLV